MNRVELKLNGTDQLLVYNDDVNQLGDNARTMNKNTEVLTDPRKEVDIKVNADISSLECKAKL
jgi:hypothetical protein